MPVWYVSEPQLNLFIQDTPLVYQPAKGDAIKVELTFRSRDNRGHALYPELFLPGLVSNFGPYWVNPWLSYVHYDPADATKVDVLLPARGYVHFTLSGGTGINYLDNSVLSEIRNGSGVLIGYRVTLSNGEVYTYQQTGTDYQPSFYFLSQRADAAGYVTQFNYTISGYMLKLTQVVDADGGVTQLVYDPGSVLVKQVIDPAGKSASFTYNASSMLSGITDAVGMTSTFTYDPMGAWVSQLTTPYGTTTFELADINTSATDRSVIVTEPNGSRQIWVYQEFTDLLNGQAWMPVTYPAAEVPNVPGNMFDNNPPAVGETHGGVNIRNSFYWDRSHSAGLPASVSLFSQNNYKIARMRHWLGANVYGTAPGNFLDTLSIERDSSSDGVNFGPKTWYDYANKPSSNMRGNQIMPKTIAKVLPDGTTWYETYVNNAKGQWTSKTETYGTGSTTRTTTRVYAANGVDLLSETGVNSNVVLTRTYNAYHQVLTSQNALGETTTYTYDPTSRLLTQISRPTGLTTTYTYNTAGRLTQTSDSPVTRTESFTYYTTGHSKGMKQTHTDARGMTRTYTWDDLGRVTRIDYPDATYETFTYTRLDLTSHRNRLGGITSHVFNNMGWRTSTTDPLNRVATFTYCDCGQMQTVVNALTQTTLYTSDLNGHVTRIDYADGSYKTMGYDVRGRKISEGDSAGTRSFLYNNQGRVKQINNAAGTEMATTFDIEDDPVSVTDANGVTVTQLFDKLHRMVARTYPDTGVERFEYSPRGMITHTNQLGKITRWTYDQARRKLTETTPNNEVIQYSYNAASDLLTLLDGKNQQTSWAYDIYGRVTSKTDAAGVVILTYTYDALDRPATRWSKGKGTTSYTVDAVGNVTLVNYPANTDISYTYDALNRVTSMTDAAGGTTFTYTSGGRLATEDGPWTSDTVTYGYNTAGLRNSLTVQQPSGTWSQSYTYDTSRRLSTVTSPSGTFTYSRVNAGHLVEELDLPNGSLIVNGFDSVGRMTSTQLKNSSFMDLNSHGYSYNVGSQRTQQTRMDGYVNYAYDGDGQLKTALAYLAGGTPVPADNRGYFYDAAWNLKYRTNNTTLQTFNVDNRNQLTSTTPAGTCAYDFNGNLISDQGGARTYTYDDENQLIQTQWGTSYQTQFVYDGLGRRRKTIENTWNGTSWVLSSETRYIYDGRRVIQERNSGNTPTVSYTRGSDLSGTFEGAGGIGGLLARSHGYSSGTWSTHHFYHADGNGNITAMVDGSQALSANYKYDPYGNLISSSGPMASANVYRFSSKEFHANSGLYYYGFRFYDPTVQRWLNRDPLQEAGGINQYRFVKNTPHNLVDPLGLVDMPSPNSPPSRAQSPQSDSFASPQPEKYGSPGSACLKPPRRKPKRDCEKEKVWCFIRGVVVASVGGLAGGPVGAGIAGGAAAFYGIECDSQQKLCEQENAKNGY